MLLMPKKLKFRYYFRIPYTGLAKGHKRLVKGDYGLQALNGQWVTAQQIEATRKAISKFTKKVGKMHINIFPHLPKSKKPLEVRMGSGKGSIDSWVAVVKKGTIMFEVSDVPESLAYEALKAASYKLPVKCKIVSKKGENA